MKAVIPYTIEAYETDNKKHPFYDWLNRQDNVSIFAILAKLKRMSEGNLGIHEPVGDGICEIKLNVGPGYRIYYYLTGKQLIILLCAGPKKSQQRDIMKAKEYLKDYKKHGRSHAKK